MAHRGRTDLPSEADAGTVLARATDGAVVDVEWRARRRLPPDGLDVVVYRGYVERAAHDRYYVVLAAGATRGDGPARVVPTASVDSTADLLSTFQADRVPDLDAE